MRNQLINRLLVAGVLLALCGCSSSSTSPDANSTDSTTSSNVASRAPAPAPPVVIAAGTVLTVTIDQNVGTKTNTSGDRFAASLAEPVTVDGNQVLPVGTKATGTVVQAEEAGHLKGGALLALSLDSLTIHGKKHAVETSLFEESGKGRGKRTAVGAGGGAAVGAIVGALAGGGKGAAIGALAGGGAGTAGAAFTGKRDITIPAETRLHFKLTKSLTISR
ncbi:MAG TPA: hypothetical protein VNM68_09280 [Candidatus Polarisedimenticolia bacterium]|nr:hypothetical protein [Candidatus Polarisedimenticolia bacterium]